jgi:hypothetical protein
MRSLREVWESPTQNCIKLKVSILTFGSIALVIVEQDVIHIFIVL